MHDTILDWNIWKKFIRKNHVIWYYDLIICGWHLLVASTFIHLLFFLSFEEYAHHFPFWKYSNKSRQRMHCKMRLHSRNDDAYQHSWFESLLKVLMFIQFMRWQVDTAFYSDEFYFHCETLFAFKLMLSEQFISHGIRMNSVFFFFFAIHFIWNDE